jgi:hypothetical protein
MRFKGTMHACMASPCMPGACMHSKAARMRARHAHDAGGPCGAHIRVTHVEHPHVGVRAPRAQQLRLLVADQASHVLRMVTAVMNQGVAAARVSLGAPSLRRLWPALLRVAAVPSVPASGRRGCVS